MKRLGAKRYWQRLGAHAPGGGQLETGAGEKDDMGEELPDRTYMPELPDRTYMPTCGATSEPWGGVGQPALFLVIKITTEEYSVTFPQSIENTSPAPPHGGGRR